MNIIDKDETISVIIPVYNVDRYIAEALDSVCNQTYRFLEIIIIDDGSTDNSAKICDEYASKDSRITVIHQPNAGAAAAKNAGLRIASGKYLAFLDSDDYLELNSYEYMLSKLLAYEADVVQCAFRDVYVNKKNKRVFLEDSQEFTVTDYLIRFTTDWTCSLLWDKLYKRCLFDGVFFEEGHKIDDEYFTYQGIMNAQKIIHLPEIVYNYRKRASSVMLSPESQKQIVLDKLDYLYKRRERVTKRFPELKDIYDYNFYNMLFLLLKDQGSSLDSIHCIRKLLTREIYNLFRHKRNWNFLPEMIRFLFRTDEAQLSQIEKHIDNTKTLDSYQYFF